MSITPPGSGYEFHKVKFRMSVLVPLAVAISNRKLVFNLVASSASATNVQIDPYTGGLFSSEAVNYLLSPNFQVLLTEGVQHYLMQMGQLIPPLQVDFLELLRPILRPPSYPRSWMEFSHWVSTWIRLVDALRVIRRC